MNQARRSSDIPTTIQDAVRHSVLQYETTAQRMKTLYRLKFTKDLTDQWLQRLRDLTSESARIEDELTYLSQEISDEIDKQTNANEDYKICANRIRSSVSKRGRTYDTNNSAIVKKIKSILDENDDQDLQLMETVETEKTFCCPVSMKTMTEPMKNKNCPHHVDRSSLEMLLRPSKKQSVECPLAGCKKQWTQASMSLDENMKLRMERFFRLQRQTAGTVNGASDATEILD